MSDTYVLVFYVIENNKLEDTKLNNSQSYYGRIENSKANLDLKTLDEILEVLEIDCIDFFTKIKVSKN